MGTLSAIVGAMLIGGLLAFLLLRAVGLPTARRLENDRRARLGPNQPDVPCASFSVRAWVNDPAVSFKGGDFATLYISAHHIGVVSHGLSDRVLVYERREAPTIAFVGTKRPKGVIRISGSHGRAVLSMFGATRTEVAEALAQFAWPCEQMWS